MALDFGPDTLFALGLGLGGAVLAGVVYFSAPTRPIARALAALLLAEGAGFFWAYGVHFAYLSHDLAAANAAFVVGFCAWTASTPLQLVLVSYLDSPLARPLRRLRATLVALAVALPAFIVLAPFWVWEGPRLHAYISSGIGGVPIFALLVAILALRRTPRSSLARSRATWFAVAFAIRDVTWGLYVLDLVPAPYADPVYDALYYVGLPLYLVLISYALLRGQLFDLDLRLKVTLRRGTVAGAFVAAFFVASELASAFLAESLGVYAGILAAGGLVFALAPLQRVADRLGEAAMPDVKETPEYLAFRKLEVYKAAVESAFESGGISDKERETLARLRSKLRVSETDAQAIERDLASAA